LLIAYPFPGCKNKRPMKNLKKYSMLIMIGLVFLGSIPVQAQFVALARKIKSMQTPETDIATVLLDAKPFMVYRAVIDTLTKNHKYQVISRDNAKRNVEFSIQAYKVSMQVDSLAAALTQITVASKHSGNSGKTTTDTAVEALIRICSMAGIKCSIDKK
jgi:hypothetical protein